MNEAADNCETEALIQGYLDGSLTEPEGSRMLVLLQRDPSLVGEILDGLRTDCLIRSVVTEAAAPVSLVAERKVLLLPAVARAFRSLVHRGPWRPRRPVILALAACVALVIGLSVWFFGPTMGEPVLVEVKGLDVSIERGTEFIPAAKGTALQPGDILRTGTNASLAVAFGSEETRIKLNESSELKLDSLTSGKRFRLGFGQLDASVAPQRPFAPMIVTTPNAEARVLGTRFTLTTTTNATQLDVSEGEVRLTRTSDHTSADVPADYYAIAAANYELAALPRTGSILHEYWTNIPGGYYLTFLYTNSNFPDRPSGSEFLDQFEAPANWSDNFGDLFRGYLIPPQTGDYSFWIAGKDGGELWLSRDSSPERKVQIAFANSTAAHEWAKSRSQHSAVFSLTGGRLYYIEALRKCGVGDDHLAVAWQPPGGQREIIPGRYLAPFKTKAKK